MNNVLPNSSAPYGHKALVFIGPPASGKNRKAKEIAGTFPKASVIVVDGRSNVLIKRQYKRLVFPPETKLIIFDDVDRRIGLDFFYEWVTCGVVINMDLKITPKIIITYDSRITLEDLDNGESSRRRFDIVDFSDKVNVNGLDILNPFKPL